MSTPTPTTSATQRRRHGFTVIELMVVLLLIGVLAGIAALNLPKILGSGKTKATRASMEVVASAIGLYKMENNAFPPTNDLTPLVSAGYLTKQSDLRDAWDNPLIFYSPANVGGAQVEWLLVSAGENGIDESGGGDDIIYYPGMDDTGA